MKKLFYSLMTLAAALTVTSCLKEVEGGSAAYDDGTLVDATFSVVLGPQTKAFATGSAANQLYAGLYEKKGETAYAYVADTKVAVSDMKGTITFEKGLQRGKSYKVVFWAQHEADGFTSPYTVKLDTAKPSVTVATSGAANDDNRDAFYKVKEFGPVTGDVAYAEGDIILKRPFAQVNVIVPNGNIDVIPAQDQKSSMTVTGAPNALDLLTGTASGEVAYSFTEATIAMTADFGNYTEHQYLAMNYVLVDQTGAGSYPVTFSVTSDAQVASNKTVNVPLKPNVRTNIVGNVFQDNFNFSGVAVVTPGTEEEDETLEIRTVTIKVDGSEPGDSEHVAVGGTSVLTLTFDGELNGSIKAISSNPNVATVDVTGEKEITVTGESAGTVTITITIPGGTKADYGERIIVIPYEVSDVQNKVAAPTFSPAAGAVAAGTKVTLTTTTADATIQYKLGDGEYLNYSDAITITGDVTITAKATKEGMTDSDEVVAAYTIAAAAKTLNGIEVTTDPTKTTYIFGESFDPTGMVVTATYSDASPEEVTGYTTNAETVFASAGTDKDVTVTYQEMTATFKVTITPATIATPVIKINDVVPTNETKVKADDVIKITTETTGVAIKYQIGEGSQKDYTDAGITLADADVTGDNVSIKFTITKDNYTTLEPTYTYAVAIATQKVTLYGDALQLPQGTSTSYMAHEYTDDKGNKWNTFSAVANPSKAPTYKMIQLRANAEDKPSYIQLPEFPSDIKSIEFIVTTTSVTAEDGDGISERGLMFRESNAHDAENIISVIPEETTNTITLDFSGKSYKTGYIVASAPLRIWKIVVTY